LTSNFLLYYSQGMTAKCFIEVRLQTLVDSGELLAMLQDCDVLGSWEEDGIIHIYWAEEKWRPAILENLRSALAQMGVEDQNASLTVNAVPDKDWNATWAASLQPIRIGRRVRIRQSWNASDSAFEGIEIIVDPRRAFGSGYHETTQLVVEWLEEHIRRGDRILDIGTGSGILAMTALRLGAGSALGIDNDPVALECARELSGANGFGSELELRTASFEDIDSGGFDVIVANLDGKTLARLCVFLPRLLSADGFACLSGVQSQDCEEIVEAATKAKLQINARMAREDWLALEVQKIK
jgi:ribosomal protein L11 methyltransferase